MVFGGQFSTHPLTQRDKAFYTLSHLPTPKPLLDMFPFDDANFNGPNFSGSNFDGFSSEYAKSTYQELDNSFAGSWSGDANGQHGVELDPFGLGPALFPEPYSQTIPSGSREPISIPSYWNATGPYEGSTVLDTAPDTLSSSFEKMFPPVNSLPGTGKSHRGNLDRFVQ